MFSYDVLFMCSLECYFGVYFPCCWNKLTMYWAQKQFATQVHTHIYIYIYHLTDAQQGMYCEYLGKQLPGHIMWYNVIINQTKWSQGHIFQLLITYFSSQNQIYCRTLPVSYPGISFHGPPGHKSWFMWGVLVFILCCYSILGSGLGT